MRKSDLLHRVPLIYSHNANVLHAWGLDPDRLRWVPPPTYAARPPPTKGLSAFGARGWEQTYTNIDSYNQWRILLVKEEYHLAQKETKTWTFMPDLCLIAMSPHTLPISKPCNHENICSFQASCKDIDRGLRI